MCLKVNKFLCCFSLETGGMTMAILSILCSVAMLISSIALLAAFDQIECPDNISNKSCHEHKPIVITITVITLIMSIWLLLISILLIKGIKSKRRAYIMPYLIVSGICVFSYFLQVFTGGAAIKTSTVISMVIQAYGFVVLYSLYEKIGNYIQIT